MVEKVERAYKGIIPSENVNKARVYHASDAKTHLWYEFWKRCVGFRFFDKTNNQHVDRYMVFAKHSNDKQLILAIAEGRNIDHYNRIQADGWFNDQCSYEWELDLATMRPVKSQQGTFNF
jgi:hypothetical protein